MAPDRMPLLPAGAAYVLLRSGQPLEPAVRDSTGQGAGPSSSLRCPSPPSLIPMPAAKAVGKLRHCLHG